MGPIDIPVCSEEIAHQFFLAFQGLPTDPILNDPLRRQGKIKSTAQGSALLGYITRALDKHIILLLGCTIFAPKLLVAEADSEEQPSHADFNPAQCALAKVQPLAYIFAIEPGTTIWIMGLQYYILPGRLLIWEGWMPHYGAAYVERNSRVYGAISAPEVALPDNAIFIFLTRQPPRPDTYRQLIALTRKCPSVHHTPAGSELPGPAPLDDTAPPQPLSMLGAASAAPADLERAAQAAKQQLAVKQTGKKAPSRASSNEDGFTSRLSSHPSSRLGWPLDGW